jgi:hypothetical protein
VEHYGNNKRRALQSHSDEDMSSMLIIIIIIKVKCTSRLDGLSFGRLGFDLGEDTEFPTQKSQSEHIVRQTEVCNNS